MILFFLCGYVCYSILLYFDFIFCNLYCLQTLTDRSCWRILLLLGVWFLRRRKCNKSLNGIKNQCPVKCSSIFPDQTLATSNYNMIKVKYLTYFYQPKNIFNRSIVYIFSPEFLTNSQLFMDYTEHLTKIYNVLFTEAGRATFCMIQYGLLPVNSRR